MAAFFTFTTFLAALLLFSVQPLIARMFLPVMGGSPAVWNTAMVFFQAVLLGGYLYAHALGTKLQKHRKPALLFHGLLLLLPFAFLPLAIPANLTPPTTAQPLLWLLSVFAICVGVPFFVLSTSSPLMQRLFALTNHRDARDPYFLYAASNAGSLIALLAYPLYFEPNLALSQQSRLWATLYCLFVVCVAICCFIVARVPPTTQAEAVPTETALNDAPISARRRLRWVVLALVPSSLMLSVTTYLSSDVAAIPLLWIVPLSLYLGSFMIVFARKPLVPPQVWVRALAILILPLVIAIAGRAGEPMVLLVTLHLVVFFLAAIVCHGELARDRPPASQLTQFFGWMALGGVVGGALNALVAPLIFSDVVEYPISLVALCLLLPRDLLIDGAQKAKDAVNGLRVNILDFALPAAVGALCLFLVFFLQKQGLSAGPAALGLMFGLPAIACFAFSRRPLRFGLGIGAVLWAGTFYTAGQASRFLDEQRSFFGVHRVLLSNDKKYVLLTHGATLHGVGQATGNRRAALSYYSKRGPIGDIFSVANARASKLGRPLRVAVLGLGGGAVAAYVEKGQEWTFYEIDPKVADIARDSRFFAFWNEAPSRPKLVVGDARLELKSAPAGAYDLILLDAYSSDTMPVHLLTREALSIYLDKLAPGGLIAWHISNAHFDLEPVVGQLARNSQLVSLTRKDDNLPESLQAQRIVPSHFAVLVRQARDMGDLGSRPQWRPMRTDAPLWTDEKSSLWSLLVRKSGL
jgi:predicted O-methyltransferase YrrM